MTTPIRAALTEIGRQLEAHHLPTVAMPLRALEELLAQLVARENPQQRLAAQSASLEFHA
jgi:hypothetical protein